MMTTTTAPHWLQLFFPILVILLLGLTMLFSTTWWLATSSFLSLLALNGQLIIFPVTNAKDTLNHLSLTVTLVYLVITILKLLVVTA